jgi:hypothetical protein
MQHGFSYRRPAVLVEACIAFDSKNTTKLGKAWRMTIPALPAAQ